MWGCNLNEWRREPVHRICVFAEHGLSKPLVTEFFEKCEEAGCDLVLDPFVGSGTVLVEAQSRGLESVGVDSNPWALVVSRAKTSPPEGVCSWIDMIQGELYSQRPFVPSSRLERYHEPLVLEALGKIRAAIEKAPLPSRPLLLTVLGELAHELSGFRKSPAPKFKKSRPVAEPRQVFKRFFELLSRGIEDLIKHARDTPPAHLVWADATAWLPDRIEAVLTSPPFANNIDYVRHAQLQLMWSGLATSSKELGALRSMQAPSCEAAARKWRPEIEEERLAVILGAIRGRRRKGYVKFLRQYFYAMRNHLNLLAERLEWEAWYTIGDSMLGGAYVPTHEILAKFAKDAGLKVRIKAVSKRIKPGERLFLLIISTNR